MDKAKFRFEIDLNVINPLQTICEVHRKIYRELKRRDQKDPLLSKLAQAFDMGKRMDAKLRQYKFNYDDGWWEKNQLDGESLNED